MILALGTHFNSFSAPQEIEGDSPLPPKDRIGHYKSCASWALVRGKYMQPTLTTILAFMLYVESHFILNRAVQMPCYILSGVCLRLMLKMGLHRDPSKLPNISAFEGEMRRRMWNMALQVELLVSFHMGLPSMMQGIEADTTVPTNLLDEDFDEDTEELPPGRPSTDWTNMTYPMHKTQILRVFGQIARQAHALTPPAYSEVLRLDSLLQETWKEVPSFMKVRPLDECVGDAPVLLIQRFGLGALFNKCRCVLHRRYLAEPIPKREHDYSRQQCLQGAITLMRFQRIMWEATRPGHQLSSHRWFISSLAVHDYLLAAMILYLVIQNEHYGDPASQHNWTNEQMQAPTKAELVDMLRRSHEIWLNVSETTTEVRKTADTLAVMLSRLGSPVNAPPSEISQPSPIPQTVESGKDSITSSSIMPQSSIGTFASGSEPLSSVAFDGTNHLSAGVVTATNANHLPASAPGTTQGGFSLAPTTEAMDSMGFPGMGSTDTIPNTLNFDSSWMTAGDNMDWVRIRYLLV